MYDDDDKVTQCCVLSRPWIKFQLRNLGFDHVAAGVPNGSWEHFNHRRLLHWTQISRQHCSRTKPCLTTIQLDSRHDYHAILWGSMVPHACNLLTNTDKTRNSVDAFTGWDVWKKSKRETNTRYSSIRHVSSAFGPASGSWTAALEQVKRWLHTVVEVTTLRPLSK